MLIRIQQQPIDVPELIERTRNLESGAIVTFQGTVRKTTGDIEVAGLYYESYEEMALKMMNQLAQDAIARFGLTDVNIIHRTGRLDIAEDSIAICVSSVHRASAFEACQYLIDTIKEKLPVWKKDILAEGKEKWRN